MIPKRPVRLMLLEEQIAKASGLEVEKIIGKRRAPELVDARHALWYVAYTQFKFSFSFIAEVYGKDHSSVIYGIDRAEKRGFGKFAVQGLRRSCPELFNEPMSGEPLSVENWNFSGEK